MARRKRLPEYAGPEDAELRWAALGQWARRFGRAVDESLADTTADERAAFTLLQCDMLALGSQLAEEDHLSAAERVERFTEQLRLSPWPWRDNPNGFRTFADSADAHVARYLRKRKEAA